MSPRSSFFGLALAIPLSLGGWSPSFAAERSGDGPRIGERAPEFSFQDLRRVRRTLRDFGPRKALVIVFSDVSCPVAARYVPRLNLLQDEYRGRGVQFLSINSSPADTLVQVAADALEKKIAFPVYKDFDQSARRALGARRTPEAVVLDGDLALRYRGRIDEAFRAAGESAGPGRAYLREALEAVLAGRRPQVEETPVEGCLIGERREPTRPGVNFAQHVAPLLAKHCQECHRPGQTAPFSLLTYQDAAARAEMIREVVEERRMPPSFSDPRHGRFVNRRALEPDEIETIAAWAAAGAPRGNPADLPPPRDWPGSEWTISEPDLVLAMPEEERVPSTGVVSYRYSVLDYVFPGDTWINEVQILPGNRRALHHANLYVVLPKPLDAIPLFITGYVPGGDVTRYGPRRGVLIPSGSRLRLQLHYVTTGREETDRTRVGLVYAKGKVEKAVRILFLINRSFRIPPGDPAYEVRAQGRLPADAVGIGLFIHMHLRGKDMTFRARSPGGEEEVLLSVPCYDFNWQMSYRWAPGAKRFPAWTEVETISHYDNSPLNPFNPDPGKSVREGPQTFQEMNYGFLFYEEEKEDLGIEVDPKTGRPVRKPPGEEAPLTPGRRARF